MNDTVAMNPDLERERLNHVIELGQAMETILATDEFDKVFQKQYLENFAITNAMNCGHYDEATMARYVDKVKARSHFSIFVSTLLEDARQAKIDIQELDIPAEVVTED